MRRKADAKSKTGRCEHNLIAVSEIDGAAASTRISHGKGDGHGGQTGSSTRGVVSCQLRCNRIQQLLGTERLLEDGVCPQVLRRVEIVPFP